MPEFSAITPEHAKTIYHAVMEDLRGVFRAGEAPGYRMTGKNVRGVVVRGVLTRNRRRQDAWLKIILDPASFAEPDRIRRFNRATTGRVRAQRIRMRGQTTMGHPWFIAEQAVGKPLLDPDRYAGRPLASGKKKGLLAETFWDVMTAYLSPGMPEHGPAPVIWYDDKLMEWQQRGAKNGAIQKRLITPETLRDAVTAVHRASERIPAPGTHYSHAHFANTELRIADSRITLIDWGAAKFVPLMYDAAFWVWNATLYAWDVSSHDWLDEVSAYEDALCLPRASSRGAHGRTIADYRFTEADLRHAFNTALAERMLGALLVDCAEGMPTTRSLTEQRHILTNVRAILRRSLERIGT